MIRLYTKRLSSPCRVAQPWQRRRRRQQTDPPVIHPSPLILSQPLAVANTNTAEAALPAVLAANEALLYSVHTAGLPWWATITAATIALRTTMTLPIAIYQQRSISRMIALAPMVQSWGETLKTQVAKESKQLSWDYKRYQKELQKQYRAKVHQIYRQHGCGRWKLLALPWIQMPLFVSMSLTIRHLAGYPLPWYGQLAEAPASGLSEGGLAWFTDLTAVDPTMAVPLLIGAGNLLNVELNAWSGRDSATKSQTIMVNAFRCLSVAFVPIAAHAPMALSLYWAISSWYSVAQNLSFRVPAIRKKLGMPPIPVKRTANTSSSSAPS